MDNYYKYLYDQKYGYYGKKYTILFPNRQFTDEELLAEYEYGYEWVEQPKLLSQFTDEELLAECNRRLAIAEKGVK